MNSSKKYGAAGHYFHSCANKETTDHYSQSRCANKNPRATICTAAMRIAASFLTIRTGEKKGKKAYVVLPFLIFHKATLWKSSERRGGAHNQLWAFPSAYIPF